MPELRSEFLMQVRADMEASLFIPDAPLGARRILQVTGGSFSGPELEGMVLPGGGDWVLDRRDGIAELDIRLALRTVDGHPIYLHCRGIFDAPAPVRQRIRSGEDMDPTGYYFRTSPVFETGSQRYDRLNRLVAVGVGRRTATGMVTEIFAVK